MESTLVSNLVNQLAEAVIMTEPDDPSALAQLHDIFETLLQQLQKESNPIFVPKLIQRCLEMTEGMIFNEAGDPQSCLDDLGETINVMQAVVNDEIAPPEIQYPQSMGVSPEPASEAQSSESQALPVDLPPNVDEDILRDFLSRQPGEMERFEELVMDLEKDASNQSLDELKRMIHTLKGETGLLGLTSICDLCHATEEAIANRPINELIESLLMIKDWLDRIFGAYSGNNDPPDSLETILGLLTGEGGETSAEPQTVVPETILQEPQEQPPSSPVAEEPEVATSFIDPSLVVEFMIESHEHLDAAEAELLKIDEDPHNQDTLNAIFRSFHTIKGVAGFIGLPDIQSLAHITETVLDQSRKSILILEGATVDIVFEAVDTMKRLLDILKQALEAGGVPEADPDLPALITKLEALANGSLKQTPEVESKEKAEQSTVASSSIKESTVTQELPSDITAESKLGEILEQHGEVPAEKINEAVKIQNELHASVPKIGDVLTQNLGVPVENVNKALKMQSEAKVNAAKNGSAKSVQVTETVKVDAPRLDRLVDAIGELVIAQAMLGQVAMKQCDGDTAVMSRNLSHLDKITRELQEMATSLRMVPVRSTFQKMARLARDVARKLSKQVNFVMEGEDTELDKTVVDRIGDPLVHMVRNALDHGMEANAQDRVDLGKPAVGTVTLRAYHKGGGICIEIQDDGPGLDKQVLLNKAIEREIINEGDPLTDQEIYHLIFAPGFSTAKEVTDVSGRGVGMDVVKRNIQALRGKVEIQSELGKGSKFTIRLPLTLAIIEGMVIRLASERYIIPTLSIVRMLQPGEVNVKSIMDQGQALYIDDELMPLVRLDGLFDVAGAVADPTQATVVIVENAERKIALLTDELIGQQQIVIKSLGVTMQGLPGIAGGAIMSDGKVGLVVDISSLMSMSPVLKIHEKEPCAELDMAA